MNKVFGFIFGLVVSKYLINSIRKEADKMVDVYVTLIVYGRRTIDKVPPHQKEAVLADLNAMGLDGYGKPLETVA